MPELPELEVYRERLEVSLRGSRAGRPKLHDPFVLRTVEPSVTVSEGRVVTSTLRRSKFLLLELEGPLFLAFHLMLAGRLHLKPARRFRPKRETLFSLPFENGALLEMTEAGSKRRTSIHVLTSTTDLARIERGIEPFDETLTPERLGALLRRENRQLKGALRDPDCLSGIGNAYSDEILFAARLSPVRLTTRLNDEEVARLHESIRQVLSTWIERIRSRCPAGLPVKQKDWRAEFAVHGKSGEPCPACGERVARISFKDSETNYCPNCQNDGRTLADRRLSRLGIETPEGRSSRKP
jgi:formamidopyrimidine-DNA glycosylase